ncbi:MAG: group II intron reverse transcriptase/maturase [Candidatus Bathyarchaeia archaeon]
MRKQKWHSLIDKVWNFNNLRRAWTKVKANRGAGGIDSVTIEQFEANLERNLKEINRLLREDRYKPTPVRRKYIPKSDGRYRPLGIPTVRDRVVQQALKNILEPIFEEEFLECSYGYRPRKNAHEAIGAIEKARDEGFEWVVDADITAFFDSVDHEKLIDSVAEKISDGRVLRLIRAFLEAGAMDAVEFQATMVGTPQGGVISPLLANIYLHNYDRAMMEASYRLIRYADDFVVLCASQEEAKGALRETERLLKELGLELHSEKTKITSIAKGVDFLGFTIYIAHKVPKETAVKKFKDAVRVRTRRQQPRSLREVIEKLNPVILGWGHYYKIGNVNWLYQGLDSWTRMRLRAFKEKRKSYVSNSRIANSDLKDLGLKSLSTLLNPEW